MKTRWKFGFTIILFLIGSLSFLPCKAQEVTIQRVEIEGKDVIVHYALIDDDVQRRYTIWLYSSNDDFIKPLEKVTGDIGVDIPVGGNKKAVWNVGEELGNEFKGNIRLELKGRLYLPFIELNAFDDFKTFKRGRTYTITWSGGRGNNVLNFDLYKGDKRIHTFANIANVGTYNLEFPMEVKPGREYRFRISDTRNQDEVVFSSGFTIKRKVPLGVKTLGSIALSVGIVFGIKALIGDPDPENLTNPPDPPERK